MNVRAWRWEAIGAGALAAAALAPAADPDLWWHLSAGRLILDERAWPRTDWLSWTRFGTPWQDFEWLSQAVFASVHLVGGIAGLWVLKVALLAAAGAGVVALARKAVLAAPARAAALALFGAGVLPRADIRTELFSLVLFAWLAAGLEGLRLEGWPEARKRAAFLSTAALFALWANLHAGFPMGLALVAAYALDAAAAGRRSWLALPLVGAAATLLNPYGFGVWSALFEHGRDAAALRGLILEWGPAAFTRLSHAGAWSVTAAAGATVLLCARRGRLPAAPELFTLALAASSLRHVRLCGYAAALAPLVAAAAARAAHGLWESERPRRFAAALCGAALALALAAARPWRGAWGLYDPALVPVGAAAWLAQRPELSPLRMYNPWSWGGYLGWRLKRPVYQDGRYLFHALLAEQAEAVRTPEAWGALLESRGVELALLEDVPLMRPSRWVDKSGAETPVDRPFYLTYMPRERWALVWTDGTALVFVRRDRLPAGFPEFRWLKPRDGAALALARGAGLIDEAAMAAELARRDAEHRGLPAEL